MDTCDVLVVGGGPAGSSCAWQLRQAGLDVVVLDKARFPRDKICAGWITPQVVESLRLDVADFSNGRVFQPIDGFHVALLGKRGVDLRFDQPVSYGIRRCEFDHYLLERSCARLRLGESISSIERTGSGWLINGDLQARMLVGAGGHFCPVARLLRNGATKREQLVTAVEVEFAMAADPETAHVSGRSPRLYFRDDLTGYGWCVRKDGYVNIGVGLVDSRETATEVTRLLEVLKADGSFRGDIPKRFHGHAYHLYDGCRSPVVDDGVLLVGDAAGLAYAQSGEGIRPAVESGLLAAQTIVDARGEYSRSRLEPYREQLTGRLGIQSPMRSPGMFHNLSQGLKRVAVHGLLRWPRFVREVVIQNSFLHSGQPALNL